MSDNTQNNGLGRNSSVQNGSSPQHTNGKPRPNQNGHRSKNFRNKHDDFKNSNGQRKRNNNNRNSQNTLKKKGVSKELIAMVNEVKKQTEIKYYSDEEILAYLEDHNQSVDSVVKFLKDKKTNSWASVVTKNMPVTTTLPVNQQHVEPNHNNNNNNKQNIQRKNTVEKKPLPQKEEIDPHAKAQDLEKTIEEQLKEIKQKELELINMKQELDHFRGGSSQSEILMREKEELIEKEKALKEELKTINDRCKEIDSLLLNVKKERAKKISEIEEKFKSDKRK